MNHSQRRYNVPDSWRFYATRNHQKCPEGYYRQRSTELVIDQQPEVRQVGNSPMDLLHGPHVRQRPPSHVRNNHIFPIQVLYGSNVGKFHQPSERRLFGTYSRQMHERRLQDDPSAHHQQRCQNSVPSVRRSNLVAIKCDEIVQSDRQNVAKVSKVSSSEPELASQGQENESGLMQMA